MELLVLPSCYIDLWTLGRIAFEWLFICYSFVSAHFFLCPFHYLWNVKAVWMLALLLSIILLLYIYYITWIYYFHFVASKWLHISSHLCVTPSTSVLSVCLKRFPSPVSNAGKMQVQDGLHDDCMWLTDVWLSGLLSNLFWKV